MDLDDYDGPNPATPAEKVFYLWDKVSDYRHEWKHKDWFRRNRKSLLDLFTEYEFWKEEALFTLRFLERTQWASKHIWDQNQIRERKLTWQPLGFDDPVKDKKAFDEISFACQNLEKKLCGRGSPSQFGVFYVSDYKLENQDIGFFYDLLKFLKDQREGRKHILATSQRVKDHKGKSIKHPYWEPVALFLWKFDRLLTEYKILPLPDKQVTSRKRLTLMVKILEIMGADFRHGALRENEEGRKLEPSLDDKINRVKKWVTDVKKPSKSK